MPCFMTGSREGDLELSLTEAREEVTKLTRLLCEACKTLQQNKLIKKNSSKLNKWWENHKRIDRERFLREKKAKQRHKEKQDALAKLTDKERKLLGYD